MSQVFDNPWKLNASKTYKLHNAAKWTGWNWPSYIYKTNLDHMNSKKTTLLVHWHMKGRKKENKQTKNRVPKHSQCLAPLQSSQTQVEKDNTHKTRITTTWNRLQKQKQGNLRVLNKWEWKTGDREMEACGQRPAGFERPCNAAFGSWGENKKPTWT